MPAIKHTTTDTTYNGVHHRDASMLLETDPDAIPSNSRRRSSVSLVQPLHFSVAECILLQFSLKYDLSELTTLASAALLVPRHTITRVTFECNMCGRLQKNVAQQFKYTEPPICTDPQYQNRRDWTLDVSPS